MPCSGPLLQQNNARTRTISSSAAPRRSMAVVNARLAKPGNTVKGTTTVGAKKQQLAKQLARQEQQQKKTLVGSKTTRGLNNSTTTSSNRQTAASKQAGTGPSSKRRGSRFYFNFTGFPFPLGPFFERKTVRTEVGAGRGVFGACVCVVCVGAHSVWGWCVFLGGVGRQEGGMWVRAFSNRAVWEGKRACIRSHIHKQGAVSSVHFVRGVVSNVTPAHDTQCTPVQCLCGV